MTYEGGEDDGKLPSVDHGRRTDRGRDKNAKSVDFMFFLGPR
jgi:hypothetical protein